QFATRRSASRASVRSVPDLTRRIDVNLNARVSLRRGEDRVRSSHRPSSAPCLRDTRSGAANESAEPQQLSDVEPDGKTRLGGEMAPVDSRYSETIDYRSSCVRSRLAPARRAPLDLQEVH